MDYNHALPGYPVDRITMTITRRLFMQAGGSLFAGVGTFKRYGPMDSAAELDRRGGQSASAVATTARSPQTTALDGLILDGGGAIFNVKSSAYGATGDGTVDDQAAIQSAIDAASFGAAVFLPAGTYKVGGEIRLREGRTLYSFGATIVGPRGSRCITLDNSTSVRGIRFIDEDERPGSNYFIYAEERHNVQIVDCQFVGIQNNCIQIRSCDNAQVIGCVFRNIPQRRGSHGVGVAGNSLVDSTNNLVAQCSFVNDDTEEEGAGAIIVDTPEHAKSRITALTIRDCHFEHMGRSGDGPRGDIDVYRNVKDMVVEGCYSIRSATSLVKGDNGENVVVRNNVVRDCGSHGIVWQRRENTSGPVDDVQDNISIQVLSNHVVNAGRGESAEARGIEIKGGPDNQAIGIVVSNNRIVGSDLQGIRVKDCHTVQITHNEVSDCGAAGIVYENTNTSNGLGNSLISGNYVDMNERDHSGIRVIPRDRGGCMVTLNHVARVGGSSPGIYIDAAVRPTLNENHFVSVAGLSIEVGRNTTNAVVNNRGMISAGNPKAEDWSDGNLVVNTDNERVWLISGNSALRLK